MAQRDPGEIDTLAWIQLGNRSPSRICEKREFSSIKTGSGDICFPKRPRDGSFDVSHSRAIYSSRAFAESGDNGGWRLQAQPTATLSLPRRVEINRARRPAWLTELIKPKGNSIDVDFLRLFSPSIFPIRRELERRRGAARRLLLRATGRLSKQCGRIGTVAAKVINARVGRLIDSISVLPFPLTY